MSDIITYGGGSSLDEEMERPDNPANNPKYPSFGDYVKKIIEPKEKLYTREEIFEATFEAMKKAWNNEPIRPSMKEKFHGNWFDKKFPV